MMKFLHAIGKIQDTGYYGFTFSEHSGSDICFGDQIWSNGSDVEIYDMVDEDALHDLIEQVENKNAFKGALRRCGILD